MHCSKLSEKRWWMENVDWKYQSFSIEIQINASCLLIASGILSCLVTLEMDIN